MEEEQREKDNEDSLMAKIKKRDAAEAKGEEYESSEEGEEDEEEEDSEDEVDSMLDSDSEEEEEDEDSDDSESGRSRQKRKEESRSKRAPSPAASVATTTATNLDLSPEFLKNKFPTLFNPPETPKILVTTSLQSKLHAEAEILCDIFPNSTYIPRSKHHHSHKYSVREIANFASNRGYTTLCVLMEDQKKPAGLDIIHLPKGPHFHFSISNWVEVSVSDACLK